MTTHLEQCRGAGVGRQAILHELDYLAVVARHQTRSTHEVRLAQPPRRHRLVVGVAEEGPRQFERGGIARDESQSCSIAAEW